MVIICIFLLSLAVPGQASQSLEFGFINAPLSKTSLAVLKVAYAKLGITVEGKIFPAARALAQSDAGMTDGEVHRIKAIAPQHPNLIRIDIPINVVEGMAVTCDRTIDTTVVENISQYHLGIKIGTRYVEKLVDGMPSVVRKADENKLTQLLKAGRLDVVIGDRPWAISETLKADGECVRINEPPLVTIPLYHYLHKRHADLVPRIAKVLREMKESGEMEEVCRQAYKDILGRAK